MFDCVLFKQHNLVLRDVFELIAVFCVCCVVCICCSNVNDACLVVKQIVCLCYSPLLIH